MNEKKNDNTSYPLPFWCAKSRNSSTNEKKIEFVNGLFAKRHENTPDFIVANLAFNENFIDWFNENKEDGWVNVDILKTKEGKLYAKKNDWKPNQIDQASNEMLKNREEEREELKLEDIPF